MVRGLGFPGGLLEFRALMYKYLSDLLDYQYDEDIDKLGAKLEDLISISARLESLDAVYAGISSLAERFAEEIKGELRSYGRDRFQAEYVSTFEIGVKGPLCPPYESEYVRPGKVENVSFTLPGTVSSPDILVLESKLEVVSQVAAFYKEYGVEAADLIPDHAVVELEFLYYLIIKEREHLNKDDTDGALRYRRAQIDFIDKHAGRWISKLQECVAKKSALKSYASLLDLINTFLIKDKKYLESLLNDRDLGKN
jgi:TorA maturation chaperone TorD